MRCFHFGHAHNKLILTLSLEKTDLVSHSTRKRPKLLIIGSSDTVSPRCFILYSYPKRRVGAYWVGFIKRGPHCSIYTVIT